MNDMKKVIRAQSAFAEKVRAVVRKIPAGSILTYKEVARRAGSPAASRAVGTILSKNYDKDVPCHRVIRADGRLGGYNRGGISKKCAILEREKALAK